MQLVLVAHRGGAALHVAHRGAFVGDDERTLELPRTGGVDAEIAGQVHRAFHPLGDVAEGAVGEDRGIERRVVIVPHGNDRSEVFAHQVGVLADRLGEGAEDDALLGEGLAEGRGHAHGVEYGIHRHFALGLHSGEHFALMQGDAELVERLHQGRVDFVRPVFGPLGRSPVDDVLEIDARQPEVSPERGAHPLPLAEGAEAEFQQPVRLSLFLGDQADDVLIESLGDELLGDLGHEAVLVLLRGDIFDQIIH